MNAFRSVLFVVLFFFVSVAVVNAREIRIQDARGLIRFSNPTNVPLTLVVTLSSQEGVSGVRMEQEDGFREPVLGERKGSGEYLMRDVTPGRYRIFVEPGSVSVKKISIQE
jgi:hypothetical protein